MCKSMFGPEVIRRVELCFFGPCVKPTSLHDRKHSKMTSDVRDPPRGYPCCQIVLASENDNFFLNKPCVMCLSWLHFQPCAGSEPDCNCCLSNKYTYMQLRSPEV